MSYVQNTEEKPSEDSFREENAESESAPDAQSPKAPSDSPAPDPRNRVDTQHTPSAGSQGAESRTSPYQAHDTGTQYAQNPNYRSADDPLKKCRMLTLVASIAGPVSLFIGGTLLDIAGLICGIISYVSLKKFLSQPSRQSDYARALKRTTVAAMAICCVAMALNIATVIAIMPELMQMLESGELANISAAPTTSAPSSTWG